ncbi:ankyrin repeat domain-containing protein [Thiotrichales bacterium 19S9-12]|nr:ankyrin repeat domain-containing protein [Thiotrichales bacterium 19S9-11]MCF6812045.1 ankyrin repeat domain-containing protein [Thiotrichales bacterium 19S9-12]
MGRTLCAAVLMGSPKAVQIIFDYDHYDVNFVNSSGESILHHAVKGNSEIVGMLLAKKPNLEIEDRRKQTPLHYAAKSGKIENIGQLLKEGANIKAEDYDGDTALHIAVKSYQLDAVKVLIDAGADINLMNKNGKKPLDCANELSGYFDNINSKIIKVLKTANQFTHGQVVTDQYGFLISEPLSEISYPIEGTVEKVSNKEPKNIFTYGDAGVKADEYGFLI